MPATLTRPTEADVIELMLENPLLTVAEARRELGLEDDQAREPREGEPRR